MRGSFQISPLFSARCQEEFANGMSNSAINDLKKHESSLIKGRRKDFIVDGYCIPCDKPISFRVNMNVGGQQENGKNIPNWRENLICPNCRMSNRQRLSATLLMQRLRNCAKDQDIYLMEQMTPLFKWASKIAGRHTIIGSEYFGIDKVSGATIGPFDYQAPVRLDAFVSTVRHKFRMFYSMLRMRGVRHEDICKLSFPDSSVDIIVSNDVFEHVPEPRSAFRECARVLRTGGVMLATIPFHSTMNSSVTRAIMKLSGIELLMPAAYHGNPMSPEGSLVYTDFGWDVLSEFLEAGFSEATVEIYADAKFGHLGGGQTIFRVTK